MFWADKIATDIIKSGKHLPYWVDDMKTPSGRIHVGALRGVAIHALIYQALLDQKQSAQFTYVFNDMDPMDGFPHYLPASFRQHMGKPLYRIPSPEPSFHSFAETYATEFIKVINHLGFNPKIIWSSQLYRSGKFDQPIRTLLDQVALVRQYYQSVSNYHKPANWYPYQVICPRCGKVGTTLVTDWDGKKVTFTCQKDLVTWAEGCGYQGKIEPTGDNGKLMWKVDWATHWQVIGVTIEGAGKDHMSAHGSHDLSSAIAENVLHFKTPYSFIYEWFMAKGGSKMSSSKGVGVSAKEINDSLPPEIIRYLLVKTPYRRAIIFDPSDNQTILKLFDEYDESAKKYYQAKTSDDARIWQLSQIDTIPESLPFYPRFRDVVNFIQNPSVNIHQIFTEIKGGTLTALETKELDKRIKYAKIWLKLYSPEDFNFQITTTTPDAIGTLNQLQLDYLNQVKSIIISHKNINAEDLQKQLYQTAKSLSLNPKLAFQALYISLLGKSHGPKAAWLIINNRDQAISRLSDISHIVKNTPPPIKVTNTTSANISLDPNFTKTYPSATVGFALIKNIQVKPFNPELETERQLFLKQTDILNTEAINQLTSIKSYRKMYKSMGIDWHSRRPSPEALLRRIATGKGLYDPINTCVDAYNLIVLKNHISVGAFDANKIIFPVAVKIAQGSESEYFLGDSDVPTQIKAGEVCYFDQTGPYNIDYNYRDAVRTQVSLTTKNIWINTEGIYDISPSAVQQTLNDVINIIQKYCGGEVTEQGILKT